MSLVVFAGTSFIQMPLTNDYSATRLFLDQIDCGLIGTQGTAIGDAIEKAMTSFGYGDPDIEWQQNHNRTIIVISDGENFEDDAIGAAQSAAAEGVMVCTIGVGQNEGAPIPTYNHNQRTGYKQDADGNIVDYVHGEEEAKRMLLVSEISHDLKNPLAGVQGYSEMLLESGCVDTEKQKDYAARIFNNSVRANKLLDSLFTYSKLGSTEYVPAFEKTDICEFTRQVFAEAISRFEDKHFTYQLDLPEEEIFVELNKDLFRRVYDNLMENSIKYNPEGTTFSIKMELEDSVKIYISDNGVGIGDTEVDRLFEPFVRGRQSGDASKNEGSGLGLAIVKQIVELHQGTIEYVKEDAPGCKYLICLARKM